MISVVVLAYNRVNEVLKTIEKLKALKQDLPYEWEIIVVDNASIDDTTIEVSRQHPDVVLVTKKQNNGIAGWNEGFKVARYKYILVLDDDSHMHRGLTEGINYLENHPDIGILALQIIDEHPVENNLPPEDAWQHQQNVVGFIGCGAIIRKEVYERIGGYAEWIYVYTHEFEYALRCLAAGYRITFFGECIVMHRVSNINRSNKRVRYYATRNEMLIVYKYFRTNKIKYVFRILINNLKFIRREGLQSGYYIFKGFIDFLVFKKNLKATPVSIQIQRFFADNFWSTRPIFRKHYKQPTSNI